MNLLVIPRLALKALGQNILRTALTMLGIIIGVGAVICVVAIGEGAQASVERAITNIGANMIWVEAGGVNRGGMYTDVDVERANAVCVLGQTVADQLFGAEDPIGETVRVNNEPCAVVGVLDMKGQSATGQDQDDQFLMPYTTVMKKIKGQIWLDDIMCSATSADVLDEAEQEIATLMRERHHIRAGAE
jgi:putative ABC transport system permease protein